MATREDLLQQQQELLSRGRLSRLELSRLNEIQTKLRNQPGVTYQEAPDYKMSGGRLVTKRGIGGFNTQPTDYKTFQETGEEIVQQGGYTYKRTDGGFETVSRPFEAQRQLDLTLAVNKRINEGEDVRAKDLTYGSNRIKLLESDTTYETDKGDKIRIIAPEQRTQAQAVGGYTKYSEGETQRRTAFYKNEQTKAEKKAQAQYESSLAFSGLQPVATSNEGKTIFSFTQPTSSKDLYGPKGTNLFGVKQKPKTFLLTAQEKKVGSNLVQSEMGVYVPKRTQMPLSINAKEPRLVSALKRFSGSSPELVTDARDVSLRARASGEPLEFLKAGAVGTGLIATYPLSSNLLFSGGLLAGGGLQSAKSIKQAVTTGEGYGKAALSVGATALDAYLTKGLVKELSAGKLVGSKVARVSEFEFNLPTRSAVRGTAVVGKQQNILSLTLNGDKEALTLLSKQKIASGSRTVVLEETYKSLFGKFKTTRLVEQNIKIKNFKLKGSQQEGNFEIDLTGGAKVGLTQKTLTVPRSQFGLGASNKIKPADLRGDIFTDRTVYTFGTSGETGLVPFVPRKPSRVLETTGERIYSIDPAIMKRNVFSVKDADMSASTFATSSEYAGGQLFATGRITPVNKNVAQVGLSTQFRLNVGGRPLILRENQRFVNEFQIRKPEVTYNADVYSQYSEVINPVNVIADKRTTFKYIEGEPLTTRFGDVRTDISTGYVFRDTVDSPIFINTANKDPRFIYGIKSTKYHEAGHLLDYSADFPSKKLSSVENWFPEYTELSQRGLTVQSGIIGNNYRAKDFASELFAESSMARAIKPSLFKRTAPKIDEYLSKFDEVINVRKELGRAQISISGRTPSKTLTSVDSDKVSGELISRQTSQVTSFSDNGQTIVSNLQLQFGKVRAGARERAPLIDIEDFQPYTDTLTSRPRIVKRVNEQFGISDEGKLAESLANTNQPTSNFFNNVGGQSQILSRPAKTTSNDVKNMLSQFSVQPTTSGGFRQLSAGQILFKQSPQKMKGLNANFGGSLSGISANTYNFGGQQLLPQTMLRQESTVSPLNKSTLRSSSLFTTRLSSRAVSNNRRVLQQPLSSLQMRPVSNYKLSSANELLTDPLSKSQTKNLLRTESKTQQRSVSKLQVRSALTQRPVTSTPNIGLPNIRVPPTFPRGDLGKLSRTKKAFGIKTQKKQSFRRTKYTPTAYAVGFGIKGKKLKGTLSGLEFRGISK